MTGTLRYSYISLYNLIYLSELQLKKENIATFDASFLELSIVIENKKLKTQLYDKRDAFYFSIFCTPHLDSQILSNIYYVSVDSDFKV